MPSASFDQWKQEQTEFAILRQKGGSDNVGKLLNTNNVNRVNPVKQSQHLVVFRQFMDYMSDLVGDKKLFEWGYRFVQDIDERQATVDWDKNNKAMYMEAVRFERSKEHEKSRFITQMQPGQGGK